MGYFVTEEPRNILAAKSFAAPKTHTPFAQMEKRGLRFYSPSIGRWMSRDPIGEYAFLVAYSHGKTLPQRTYLRNESLKPLYPFVHNSPIQQVDPLGLTSLCDAFMPGMPGAKYAIGPGDKCFNRDCLVGACDDFLRCCSDAVGGIWGDLGKCLIGCLPALYFGPGAYGGCVAACTGTGTAIQFAACLTEYQARKSGCEVDKCYCRGL